MRKVKVAMIGTGDISGIYVQNITHMLKRSTWWVCAI